MERLVCFLALCAVVLASGEQFDNEEAKVYRELMKNYDIWNPDRNIPPAKDGDAVTVTMGESLGQLLHVDGNNIATLIVWETYIWKDAALRWSNNEVSSIRMLPEKIWTPDIELYNRLDSSSELLFNSNVIVNSDGTIVYIPHKIRKVQCTRNNGTLICSQKLGSWTYDGSRIDIQLISDKVRTSYYKNSEWEVVEAKAERHAEKYECCPEEYIDVTFDILFRKRA